MRRFTVVVTLVVAVMGVVAGALLTAGDAGANVIFTTISGTADGRTIPLPDGTFKLIGTLKTDDGTVGTYSGTYVEETTGYTSCLDTFGGSGPSCLVTPAPQCNRVIGEINFRIQGKTIHYFIRNGALSGTFRFRSGVCLGVDPSVHVVELRLLESLQQSSQNGWGNMFGTSTPAGEAGVYAGHFSVDLILAAEGTAAA